MPFKLQIGIGIICGNDPVNRHDPLGLLEAESEGLIRGIGYAAQGLEYSLNQLAAGVEARGRGWTPWDQYQSGIIQAGYERTVSDSMADIARIENSAEEARQIAAESAKGWSRPSLGASFIPVVGPFRGAVNNFQNGRPIRGTIDSAMTIADAFLVGTIYKAGAKALAEGGMRAASGSAAHFATEATGKEVTTAVERELSHAAGSDARALFPEYMRYRGQGFTPAQAKYLAAPYQGMGHHFIPRRSPLPTSIVENPANIMGQGMTRGGFYERHFLGDPHFHGTAFPARIGGTWSGHSVGLIKPMRPINWWYAAPDWLRITGGVGAFGGRGAAVYNLSGDE